MTATPAARLKQAEDFLADWPDRASAFALTGILAAVVAAEERTVADDYLRDLSDRQDAALGRVLALADTLDEAARSSIGRGDDVILRAAAADIRATAKVEEPKTDAEKLEDALREHRLDWAAHLESVLSAVSPGAQRDRPAGFAETTAMIVDALRSETLPFGKATS